MVQVTVWNEFYHERDVDEVAEIYPDGIHHTIADALAERGHETRTATMDEPEHGLSEEVLDETDVLIWWGHMRHDDVEDRIAERVQDYVLDGMGFIPLHSSHYSKPFGRLMGTSCALKWREAGERERLWVIEPGHPIADGVDEYLEIPEAEMYGERADIPAPETLVFVSWFEGGEVFRSGCCYHRGRGKIFYFRPGHETYPIYHRDDVMDVISNGVEWAAPSDGPTPQYGNSDPLEELEDPDEQSAFHD